MQSIKVKSMGEMLLALGKLQFQFGHSPKGSGFLFRGHQDSSYALLPGLYRQFSKDQQARLAHGSISGKVYTANENEILAHFRKEASGILSFVDQNDDFTWLQYAQHYGVPTRLLDFSSNPLVALYFCCKGEKACDGAIWVLNSYAYQRWMFKDAFCTENEPEITTTMIQQSIIKSMNGYIDYGAERVEMRRPLLFVPAYIDQRMSAQSSRFLLWGADERPLDMQISSREEMNLSSEGIAFSIVDDTRFLSKIIIPDLCKHDILRSLELMNVAEKTVFPGLDGIGRYIEQYYRNNPDDSCRFL